MPAPVKKHVKKFLPLLMAITAVAGFSLWDNRVSLLFFAQQSPPPSKEVPKALVPPPVTVPGPGITGSGITNPGDAAVAPSGGTPAPAASEVRMPEVRMPAKAGSFTFGDFVNLRSEIEKTRLDAQLHELKKKMEKPQPAPPPRQEFVLPPLPSPASKPAPVSIAPDAVMGVQGMDGDLSAVIRTSAGRQVTVKQGDKFGGGVVSAISRSGVVIRRNKTFSTIPFE
jgi:type IV pilus biogenesis protein PilP